MSLLPTEMPLFDSRIQQKRSQPSGRISVTITVVTKRDHGSYHWLRVKWRRRDARKMFETMVLRGPVSACGADDVESTDAPTPVVVNAEYLVGVQNGCSYDVVLDLPYHGIRFNEAWRGLEFQIETGPIDLLELLAIASGTTESSRIFVEE